MEQEIRIRVTEEFKEKLHKKAKELNISLSAYVRLVLTQSIDD